MKLAIAQSYNEFRTICNLAKVDYRDYRYLSGAYAIRGFRDTTLYRMGQWWENRMGGDALDEIGVYCQSHNIKIVNGAMK